MISRSIKLYLSFIGLIFNSGCSDTPVFINHVEKYSGLGENEVYVVSHAWHTGFVIPADKLYESIPALRQRFGQRSNIEIGWGDKEFYQAEQITSGLALKAILWPTETVIHAVAIPHNISGYFANSEVEMLCLNDGELSSLVKFISSSFYKNDLGVVKALEKGLYGDSQFYKGAGDYHIMNTCNKWTAKGLKSVGMDITPAFKLSAESIMNYLREVNSASTKAAKPDHSPRCPVSTDATNFNSTETGAKQ
jgi:uncharacterized protein (TIGR02117 family)